MNCTCGCCTTAAAPVPAPVENRPGLPAIAYRIGTFAQFRQAILDQLSRTPALGGLAARTSEDYAVTVIELWSAVADVLTFYQERIANEAYLTTAVQRDSVLRLVRLIGYEFGPGAAATAQVAFTLERDATALIPAGTRVQSVPGTGETPQKYETLSSLAADARLNALRIRSAPIPARPLGPGVTRAIAAPDRVALADAAALATGDRVIAYSPSAFEVLTVGDTQVEDDDVVISWELPPSGDFSAASDDSDPQTRAYALGRSFHLFGFDAPVTIVVPYETTPNDPTTTILVQTSTDFSLHGDGTSGNQLSLDARYGGLKPGATLLAVAGLGAKAIPFEVTTVGEVHVTRGATGAAAHAVAAAGTVTQVTLNPLTTLTVGDLLTSGQDIRDVVVYELLGDPLRFWPFAYPDRVASPEVVIPGRRAGWSSVEVGRRIQKGSLLPGVVIALDDMPGGRAVVLADGSSAPPLDGTIAAASLLGAGVTLRPTNTDATTIETLGLSPELSTAVTAIVSRSFDTSVAFPNPRRELTVKIGSLPAQTIGLSPASGAIADVASVLQKAIRAALPGTPTFAHALAWDIGPAIAILPGVPGDGVAFGPSPNDPDTVMALGLDSSGARFLDGVMSTPVAPLIGTTVAGEVSSAIELAPAQTVALSVAVTSANGLAAALGSAMQVLAVVTDDQRVVLLAPLTSNEQRAFIALALDVDAPPDLDATTALLLGNVAPASQGETVSNEILGDGDASQAFQRFKLKKSPVTYVPAVTPGALASSLRVMVGGIAWSEVPTLYGAAASDQVYVTRIADDATMTVQFGDGVTGARLPTGRQNVTATYRQGLGVAGRVTAGKLTTPLDRPTGLRSVTNLLAADGGADPQTMADARTAAPATVRTFGRAVALRDFEDATLMSGEVAKASASWVWTGLRRAIHVTIAAQQGALFSADALKRLAATLAVERDPNQRLLLDNYSPVGVVVAASIVVDPRRVTADVLAAAEQALLDDLSFERRTFAQPVYLSDIFAVLQGVDGVLGVDVTELDLKNSDPVFLAAHGVDESLGQPQPRLLMLPARPSGSPGVVLPAELARIEAPAQDVTLTATGGITG